MSISRSIVKKQVFLLVLMANTKFFATINSTLVNIKQASPTLIVDLKYATNDNFTGQIIYLSPLCLVHKDTARALKNAQKELNSMKLSLKIWDGYRSPAAQQKLWDVCAVRYPNEKEREKYVSNPKNGGRHTRGTAVDVTLVDENGKELEMPTRFDDFSVQAWTDDETCSVHAQRNRKLLHDIMHKHGFEGIKTEWWHFDLKGWRNYQPIILLKN